VSVNLAAARAGRARAPGAVRRGGLVARLVRLYLGLAGFGVSLALMVRAQLGLGPWDVLHQGIARLWGVQLGWVTIGVSGLVLLAWIPLRQRPGLGTVSNAVIVGLVGALIGAVGALAAGLPAVIGSAWRAAQFASWKRRPLKNASCPRKTASGRSRANATKAVSISRLVPALTICV